MKVFLLVCLVVAARANFLDSVGHALSGAAHSVGDAAKTAAGGVVDAAQTVGDGVETAAHAVAGVLPDVASTLGSTFKDVWNVAKDPLKEAGEQLLKEAAAYALEQGVTMALDALAAGKRDIPDRTVLKQYLSAVIQDEYQKWLKDTEDQILGSKDELLKSMSRFTFQDMPEELKNYVNDYAKAKIEGKSDEFVVKQATTAYANALKALKSRLTDRVQATIASLTH
ncbi:uncharacterized protein LOC132717597 [Ruditapes philippinarum]|uniref:uncharacterized protein LOC132717597 n=1 Tax=Ruditapes philippinarum TaxID=129788 RepID=UPI00295B9569|nr:uncharacterized protein LOC132717597 [Ruditapes philippinarum]